MIGFAFFATFCFGKGALLRQSAGPVYYELSAAPGPHKLTLEKPGLSPGYRVRLVRRADRNFDQNLSAQLSRCEWRIDKCEKLALSRHTFDPNGVIEFESEYPDLVLQYESVPEVQSLLEAAAVELKCPAGFLPSIGHLSAELNLRRSFFLGALILAGLGAWVQRRKLRAARHAGKTASMPPTPLTG